MSDYRAFLASKSQLGGAHGFSPTWLPDFLFPFQRRLVEWAVRMGRGALTEDCGLGKTPQFLVWGENVVRHANKPVLILTPLAVSYQTVREAEKFGVEAHRSPDGRPRPNITVTNYERLDRFDPDDYAGVVCDECFAPGTKVDAVGSHGEIIRKDIEDIRVGDKIINAAGVDEIVAAKRREVTNAVLISASADCVASPNHPFFTQRGWVRAQHLRAGDYLLGSAAAVSLVRHGVLPEVAGVAGAEVLRDVLLGELADERPGAGGEVSHARGQGRAGGEEIGVAALRLAEGRQGDGTHPVPQPGDRPRRQGENLTTPAGDRARAACPRRDRHGGDGAGSGVGRGARGGVGDGTHGLSGATHAGVSDPLQAGRVEPRPPCLHRGGRLLPLLAEGAGPEEGREVDFARVDGVEVLEPGDPRLDRFRDADGTLRFYDLEAARHPSFSVNGWLVHNSSILKHWSGATQKAVTRFLSRIPYRLLCSATPAPNDYVELGTSSEALGGLTHSDMLATFFRQMSDDEKKRRATADDVVRSRRLSWRVIQGMGQWAMKAHAFGPFWRWVASWARAARRPSDVGPYDDTPFVLPPLDRHDHVVPPARPPEGWLFTVPAFGLNLQHCAHVVTFITHSYEQFHQCVSRCRRFGQKRRVRLDVIATDGEVNVARNMARKERLHAQMFDEVVRHMNDALAVSADRTTRPVEVPSWLS